MGKMKHASLETASMNNGFKSVFSDLGPEESNALKLTSTEHFFGTGQTIPTDSADQTGLFLLQNGFVFLRRNKGDCSHGIRIVGPGDLFCSGTFWSPHAYTGIALSSVTARFFEKEAFFDLKEKWPSISREFLRWLFRDLSIRDDRIETLESHSVKVRVAGTLLSLYSKFGKPSSHRGLDLPVPIDRKGLAELSGTIIETLARVLTDFEERHILERNGRKLTLLNMEELKKIANS